MATAENRPANDVYCPLLTEFWRHWHDRWDMTEESADVMNFLVLAFITTLAAIGFSSCGSGIDQAIEKIEPLKITFPDQAVVQEAGRLHMVAAGETLQSIADNFGVSWIALAHENNILNTNEVFPGMELIIPNS